MSGMEKIGVGALFVAVCVLYLYVRRAVRTSDLAGEVLAAALDAALQVSRGLAEEVQAVRGLADELRRELDRVSKDLGDKLDEDAVDERVKEAIDNYTEKDDHNDLERRVSDLEEEPSDDRDEPTPASQDALDDLEGRVGDLDTDVKAALLPVRAALAQLGVMCQRCGSVKPADQSCGCFDNGGQ